MFAGAGLGGYEIQVGMHPLGDENLGAVEHPVVTVFFRGAAHTGQVGARAWFGHGNRTNGVACNDAGHVLGFLRLGARMVQMRAGHVGVHQHADDETGKRGLRQGLGKDQIGQGIGFCTAVVTLEHQAKKAGIAHFFQHLARHLAALFPFQAIGLHLTLKEALHLVAQGLVFG